MQENESLKFRLEMGEEIADGDFEAVEYEILPPVEHMDRQRFEIYTAISEIDHRLRFIENRVAELNSSIDSLTDNADKTDYLMAVASGVLTGIADGIFNGEFSLDSANAWGNKQVEKMVISVAKQKGFKGEDLPGAVKYMEKMFPLAADKATNAFGGGKQHHLRDFTHHASPAGLICSVLTQFTNKVYGVNVNGGLHIAEINSDSEGLIGETLHEKFVFGVINWFFHMVSDMAGSSSSVSEQGLGTGIPGPVVSTLKEISALPLFNNLDENDRTSFSVWISKLFNGTLLAKRDASGNITEPVKVDFRTELGIANEAGKQALPVVLNECFVKAFFFIRRLYTELKEKNVQSIKDLEKIEFKKVIPFSNRTISRMMTVATGTFTAIDMADASIRAVAQSGGLGGVAVSSFILRVNFVGVGRFAVAVTTDLSMGFKKTRRENECMNLRGEQLKLLDAKMFYKVADAWIEAEKTEEAFCLLTEKMSETVNESAGAWLEIEKGNMKRKEYIEKIQKNKKLKDELSELIEWGEQE